MIDFSKVKKWVVTKDGMYLPYHTKLSGGATLVTSYYLRDSKYSFVPPYSVKNYNADELKSSDDGEGM